MAIPSSLAGGKNKGETQMKKITMADSISTREIKELEVGQEIDNGVFNVLRENNPDFEYYYNVSVYRANGELTHLKFCLDRFEVGYIMDTFILGVFFAGYGIYEYDKEKD